ncbi:unnamed protein product [Colias eurytheme]|nr:unnamed protein product [Colias eurytheme]
MSLNESLINDDYFSLSSSSEESFHSTASQYIPINIFLNNCFPASSKQFNVVHINAQSIPAHYTDFLASFESSNVQAICVSESWLKPSLPSSSYSLPGFRLIRNDRIGRGGGGVAIYLRSQIPFTILSSSPQPTPADSAEHLFLEIIVSHVKILLGVVYSPSSTLDFFPSFDILLEQFTPSYSHTIIMGDFNTCLLKRDSRSYKLEAIIDSYNLHILPLQPTHHFPNSIPSLLDLIIISNPNFISNHGQCSADAFSYHNLIFLSYNIRPPKSKPQVVLQRNFSRMDLERLCSDAKKIDWNVINQCDNVNDKVEIFNSLITQLYDVHAPVKPIKLKHLPAPWLTENIKSLLNRKNQAKGKFKSSGSDDAREKYIRLRNRCNTLCRDAQRRHIHTSVENSDSCKIWKFLRSLGVGKQKHSSSVSKINTDELNAHFSNIQCNFDSATKARTLNNLSSTSSFPSFSFQHFSDLDVKKSLLSISSTAVGCDNVSRAMILPIIDIVIPVIAHILNFSISSGVFPSVWKDTYVIPLPKKPNPSSFSEFRPISILPFLSKILERLVHQQLNTFINKHNILNPLQSGFRPGHSTATALVKITDDIRAGMDDRLLTVLTLLDFSNAFNCVDFDILLKILSSHNMSALVLQWLHSYLSGRRQRIKIDDSLSSWSNLTAGVPQGGILSPLLFAIYINNITKDILSQHHIYADDLQIYTQASISDLSSAISTTNTDLATIVSWSKQHGLHVNPIKTQSIIVGSSQYIQKLDWENLPPITVDGVVVPYSKNVKNLGLCIDRSLSWNEQVKQVSKKIYAASHSLKRIRNFLPIPTKILLAQSLLLPILDYADVSYPDLTELLLDKLERFQNLCIRFIFGLRKYDHVSDYRARLRWLPIRLRRDTHILHLLYKVLFYRNTPSYLKDKFQYLCTHGLNLRSHETLSLCIPTHKSFYNSSFTVKAIKLWNDLPVTIRKAQTFETFKRLLNNHYNKK